MRALRDALVWVGLGLFDLVSRSIPTAALLHLADAVGTVWYALDRGRRRTAADNLRIAFGALDPGERRRLTRGAFRSLARIPAESLHAGRLLRDRAAVERRVRWHGDEDALRRDLLSGRGGILATAHLGNWEVAGLAARAWGVPLRAVMRSLGSPAIDAWVRHHRGGGLHALDKRGATRALVTAIRAGAWAGIVSDQNAGRHGVFVPFFGRPACTYRLPGALAARLDVPFYAVVCVRRPGVLRFEGHVRRLEPPPGAGEVEAARALLAGAHAFFEARIRRAPDQYNWLHRRWKTRPPDERPGPNQPRYARFPYLAGTGAGNL